jgi:hypothetical protein
VEVPRGDEWEDSGGLARIPEDGVWRRGVVARDGVWRRGVVARDVACDVGRDDACDELPVVEPVANMRTLEALQEERADGGRAHDDGGPSRINRRRRDSIAASRAFSSNGRSVSCVSSPIVTLSLEASATDFRWRRVSRVGGDRTAGMLCSNWFSSSIIDFCRCCCLSTM